MDSRHCPRVEFFGLGAFSISTPWPTWFMRSLCHPSPAREITEQSLPIHVNKTDPVC